MRTEEVDKRLTFSIQFGVAAITIAGVLLAAIFSLLGQMLIDRSATASPSPQQPAVQSVPAEDAGPEPGTGSADPSTVGSQASAAAADPD